VLGHSEVAREHLARAADHNAALGATFWEARALAALADLG